MFFSFIHFQQNLTNLSSPPPLPPSKAFNNWMDNTMDDLQDAFVCSSTEEVEQLQNELEEFKAGPLQEANENYDELNGFVTRMAELGSTDNPYTTLTPTVSTYFSKLIELILDISVNYTGYLSKLTPAIHFPLTHSLSLSPLSISTSLTLSPSLPPSHLVCV